MHLKLARTAGRRLAWSSLLLGAFVGACSDKSTITGPSVEIPVHNTLNEAGGRSNTLYYASETSGPRDDRVYDDFVSPTATTIRTVKWQGGYSPNKPAATSFTIAFFPDNGAGFPKVYELDRAGNPRSAELYRATYSVDQVNEQLDAVIPCTWTEIQQCGLYTYSLTLTPPFSASGGVRYWMLIQADVPFGGSGSWGWRRGTPDDNRAGTSIANAYFVWDLAFSLTGFD